MKGVLLAPATLLLLHLLLFLGSSVAEEYDSCAVLSWKYETKLSWRVELDTIHFQLITNRLSSQTSNWVGFGIASTPIFPMISNGVCSDLMIASASGACPPVVPEEDNCSDDGCTACIDDLWVCEKPLDGEANGNNLLSSARDTNQDYFIDAIYENSTNVVVEFHRLLNTGDPQDRAIELGEKSVVVWALGPVSDGNYMKHIPDGRGFVNIDFGAPSFCNGTQPIGTNLGYTSPEGDFVAYWEIDAEKETITFAVQAQSEGWAALGISNGNVMPQTDVVIAYIDEDGAVKYYDGFATEHNLPAPDASDDVMDFTGSVVVESGITLIKFQYTRKLDTGDALDVALDRAKSPQYLLYAHGPMSGSRIMKHTTRGVASMDFFAGIASEVGVTPAQKAHGALMMIGWVILLTSGALVGHKYREFTDRWFYTHVGLQVTGSVFVLAAFITIFAEKGGFVLSAHAVIGVIVFVFMLCQIILGIISNRVPAVREKVHIIHRWLGRLTIILAFVNIMLGFSVTTNDVALYVVAAIWFLLFVGAFFVPLTSRYQEFDESDKQPQKHLTPASKALFAGYLGLAVVVVAVLVAILSAPKVEEELTVIDIELGAPSILINFDNFTLPSQMTNYVCLTLRFNGPSIDAIKISPIVDNAKVVHHIVLFDTPQLYDQNEPVWECTNMPSGIPVYIWAVGGEDMIFPEDVGLRFGGEDGIKYAVLQMHYDLSWAATPEDTVERDSSGIKIFFSDELQQHQMDVFILGINWIDLQLPPGRPNYQMENTCPGSATAGLPHPLNVFSTGLHMHKLGKSIYLEHYRNGNFLGYIAHLPQYDFNNQQWQYGDHTIMPGDDLVTRCIWDTSNVDKITLGGEDTDREMCFSFIAYYPKLEDAGSTCFTK